MKKSSIIIIIIIIIAAYILSKNNWLPSYRSDSWAWTAKYSETSYIAYRQEKVHAKILIQAMLHRWADVLPDRAHGPSQMVCPHLYISRNRSTRWTSNKIYRNKHGQKEGRKRFFLLRIEIILLRLSL
jgi:hypothetical protein